MLHNSRTKREGNSLKLTAITIAAAAALTLNTSYAQSHILIELLKNLSATSAREEKEAKNTAEVERLRQEEAARKQELEQLKAEEAAAWEERRQEVAAGRAQPVLHSDLVALYSPANGHSVTRRPLVKPDNKLYIINGLVEDAGPKGLVVKTRPRRDEFVGDRFIVWYTKNTKRSEGYDDVLRINGPVSIVGNYTANREMPTLGGMKIIPGFTAVHVLVDEFASY